MTTLAELRLANLREQKKSAQEPEPPAAEPVSAPSTASAPPEVPGPILQTPEVTYPNKPQEDFVLSQYLTDADQDPPPEIESDKSARLIARVHESLAHKVLHPTGAKATVDMSPALFHRAKRYCLDHGNVTLRQLFLDLMTAFLDEEGY